MNNLNFGNNSIDYIKLYIKQYENLMKTEEFKKLVEAEDRLIVTSAYKSYICNEFNILFKLNELDIENIMGNKEKYRVRYNQISPWTGGIIRNHMMLMEDHDRRKNNIS